MNVIIEKSTDPKSRIYDLARFGATEEDIAAELEIPLKRLQKRFRRELRTGEAKGKHEVLEKLFETAKACANVAATSLWVKARCGWRDTGAGAHSPAIVHSILQINTRGSANNPSQT
jgi:hypothetical protein